MRLQKLVELMGEYSACPTCGNKNVGNGEGTIVADGDTFRRTCKCGWSIEVNGSEERESDG